MLFFERKDADGLLFGENRVFVSILLAKYKPFGNIFIFHIRRERLCRDPHLALAIVERALVQQIVAIARKVKILVEDVAHDVVG